MKKVAVIQSNYIPWKGYFDIIHDVDLFIFYDDVQYTKNDWRNRNRIKVPQGTAWLSIPVGKREDRLICEVDIAQDRWAQSHWRSLLGSYGRAPFFSRYSDWLHFVYLEKEWRSLSELNQYFITHIAAEFLGITARFEDSRRYAPQGARLERLLDLLRKAGAQRYVSGPAARDYIDPARFTQAGIELAYKDYTGYPEYEQVYPPFVHEVSILDLLFHNGPHAADYIWGFRGGN